MKILKSATLDSLEIKNRLVRSATWEGLCGENGEIPSELTEIYRSLAEGGVGLIVTGLTDVCPYDIALKGNMRLVSDDVIPQYRLLTDSVHAYGAKILSQLNINIYTRPSGEQVPINEMTEGDIELAISFFRDAAVRAEKAGFDGVQLHLAYGWLLNRFLNPSENKRTDLYGGSIRGRFRIILRIISEIRSHAPSLHISAKFSFFRRGDEFDTEECEAIALFIAKYVDSLELLGEGSPLESDRKSDSIYLPLALPVIEKVKEYCPIILTGNNREVGEMERLHNEYGISAFGLCRALIRESDLPNKFLKGSSSRSLCRACGGCNSTSGSRCIFNIKKA